MTSDVLKKSPKIELHCHLDGSLRRQFIQARLGRDVPDYELSVSDDCDSLQTYLEKFALPGQCLTDEKGLSGAGYDVLSDMSKENIQYAEIRFAPLLHISDKFHTEKVIESLLKGLEQGKKDFGIDYNVIVCAMRHHSEKENYEMIKTARAFLGQGVCAADLAGAEAIYPMSDFMELFGKVKRLEMPFTIHAGECGSVQNILNSVEAGAERIGHGIAMAGHPEVQKLLRDKRIGVELCPLSNLQTKAVRRKEEYPIKEFLDAGVLVTVNTDNRTVSNTTLTKEFEFVQKHYGITDEQILLMTKNAIEVAFADDSIKHRLYQKI